MRITFSEPIEASSFTRDDLQLLRSGDPTNLITNAVRIEQSSPNAFDVSGLAALTANDGEYQLLVDARGLVDLTGNVGEGIGDATWTKATSTLAIVDIVGTTGLRNTPVAELTVNFNRSIDASSFTTEDITVHLDGVNVPLELTNVKLLPRPT